MFRVQGLNPDRWSGCFSWPNKCRFNDGRGVLHRSGVKTFARRLYSVGNPVKGGCGLNGIVER